MKIKNNNFVFNDNDFDQVVFENDYINYYSDEDEFHDDIEPEPELEWLLPEPPDIYSNDHPWDTLHQRKYRFRPDVWLFNIDYTE